MARWSSKVYWVWRTSGRGAPRRDNLKYGGVYGAGYYGGVVPLAAISAALTINRLYGR